MIMALAELQQSISERYLTIVRDSANGLEVDPKNALEACVGMGRSVEQMSADVELCEQRIAKVREFEAEDYTGQIEQTKVEKAQSLRKTEKALAALEKAQAEAKDASDEYGALTSKVAQLSKTLHDASRELSRYLRSTGTEPDWEDPENFRLTT